MLFNIWKSDIPGGDKINRKRKKKLENTLKKLYGILWVQKSERKCVKVQAVDKFKEIEEIQDPVKLELVLRQVAYNVQYKTYFPLSEWTINQRLHLPRQDKGM